TWQNSEKEKEEFKKQEEYWLGEYKEDIPLLNLPIDFVRPVIRLFEGNTVEFALTTGETAALKRLALEKNATLFMILLTLYNIFIAKISGQETLVVGTPVAGRRHADLENIIGMFVNTLPLKNEPAGNKTFLQLLDEIKSKSPEAFEKQDYQYETLVDALSVERHTGRNPLFDTLFSLQNIEQKEIDIPGLALKPYAWE
ncbi:MAG: hypothetical protein GY940_44235, partial [bacterium]|nr:hypothetical protein [bacterium]